VHAKSEDRSDVLASAFRESLRVAEELGAATVAFPAVSAGIYGWPMDDCARIAVATVRAHEPRSVQEVRFVLFDQQAYDVFQAELDRGS
jgi:O-acetyl-ADP-ribose deacetylase (regulator of RNase III)